jgi:hypothetical protein
MVEIVANGREFKKAVKKLRAFVDNESKWEGYGLYSLLFVDKDLENVSVEIILFDEKSSPPCMEDWIVAGKSKIKSISADRKIRPIPIGYTRMWMIEKVIKDVNNEDVHIMIRSDDAVFINNVSV